MGLVRNLKKILSNMADKVLAELCYLYILQKAEQTTKRQGNSLITKSLQNPLTTGPRSTIIATSSQGTSEKITMEMTTDDIVAHTREWALDKIEEAELCGDKIALYAEFEEWIEIEDEDELEIVSLEPDT